MNRTPRTVSSIARISYHIYSQSRVLAAPTAADDEPDFVNGLGHGFFGLGVFVGRHLNSERNLAEFKRTGRDIRKEQR